MLTCFFFISTDFQVPRINRKSEKQKGHGTSNSLAKRSTFRESSFVLTQKNNRKR